MKWNMIGNFPDTFKPGAKHVSMSGNWFGNKRLYVHVMPFNALLVWSEVKPHSLQRTLLALFAHCARQQGRQPHRSALIIGWKRHRTGNGFKGITRRPNQAVLRLGSGGHWRAAVGQNCHLENVSDHLCSLLPAHSLLTPCSLPAHFVVILL